ncbi:unnamed protein product [Chrysodeixis includens]|uniref:Uncharacterized protein n=1 Tax=Chrysodeixis includens TaxID=689277 RepID=A0A9N8PY23_CHRIL|nr:unnamed protein product [Chrysodeixis includens]
MPDTMRGVSDTSVILTAAGTSVAIICGIATKTVDVPQNDEWCRHPPACRVNRQSAQTHVTTQRRGDCARAQDMPAIVRDAAFAHTCMWPIQAIVLTQMTFGSARAGLRPRAPCGVCERGGRGAYVALGASLRPGEGSAGGAGRASCLFTAGRQ